MTGDIVSYVCYDTYFIGDVKYACQCIIFSPCLCRAGLAHYGLCYRQCGTFLHWLECNVLFVFISFVTFVVCSCLSFSQINTLANIPFHFHSHSYTYLKTSYGDRMLSLIVLISTIFDFDEVENLIVQCCEKLLLWCLMLKYLYHNTKLVIMGLNAIKMDGKSYTLCTMSTTVTAKYNVFPFSSAHFDTQWNRSQFCLHLLRALSYFIN